MIKFAYYGQIHSAIKQLADQLNELYKLKTSSESPLCLVVIAPAAIKFYAELCSLLTIPNVMCLVQTQLNKSMYADSVEFVGYLPDKLEGNHVLILEGMCTSGITVKCVKDSINLRYTPASMSVAALVVNTEHADRVLTPDFVLFDSKGKQVFGFGLDSHDDLDRNLISMYYKEEQPQQQ